MTINTNGTRIATAIEDLKERGLLTATATLRTHTALWGVCQTHKCSRLIMRDDSVFEGDLGSVVRGEEKKELENCGYGQAAGYCKCLATFDCRLKRAE